MDTMMDASKTRVLVLEDDPIVAMDLSYQVADLGLEVCGPYHRSRDALDQIERDAPDFAILDFNLKKGRTSETVAKRLSDLGIPFCFLSGYSSTKVMKSAGFDDIRCLSKPVVNSELTQVLSDLRSRDS